MPSDAGVPTRRLAQLVDAAASAMTVIKNGSAE
jgi:hypothetical protein